MDTIHLRVRAGSHTDTPPSAPFHMHIYTSLSRSRTHALSLSHTNTHAHPQTHAQTHAHTHTQAHMHVIDTVSDGRAASLSPAQNIEYIQ